MKSACHSANLTTQSGTISFVNNRELGIFIACQKKEQTQEAAVDCQNNGCRIKFLSKLCFDSDWLLNTPVFQPHLLPICVHSLLRMVRCLLPCVSGTVEVCGLQDAQIQPVGVQSSSGGGSKPWVSSEFKQSGLSCQWYQPKQLSWLCVCLYFPGMKMYVDVNVNQAWPSGSWQEASVATDGKRYKCFSCGEYESDFNLSDFKDITECSLYPDSAKEC